MKSPAKVSLLIVDDDETLAGTMSQLFRLEGYEVTVASDGLHALHVMEAGLSPDVILLDMHMPGVNGWELAAELQALQHKIPVVVITGDADPAACARQVGAAGWVAKPVGANELIGAVEFALIARS